MKGVEKIYLIVFSSLVNGQVEKKPEPPANGSEPSQTQQKKKKRKKSKMTAGEEET